MVPLTPIPNISYDHMIIVAPPVDLTNATTCIPSADFIQFAQIVVFKETALRLGLVCFITGLVLMYGFWQLDLYLKARGK
jgi:hypothetical protein